MNLTITPLIKIVALIGVVAILALGAGVVLLGRSHSTATPAAGGARHGTASLSERKAASQKAHVAAAATAHAKTKTHAKATTPATHAKKTTPATAHKTALPPKAATTHKATTHKATTHKATTHKHAKAVFRGNPVYADLPTPLQWQLAHHKVVVVSLYNPNAEVDTISVAEAHAGATAANAGFLLVSVLDNKVAGILTALLPGGGLLPEPGVLVYRAPGTIAVRMDGFADRDSVAQAAANAFLTPAATVTP